MIEGQKQTVLLYLPEAEFKIHNEQLCARHSDKQRDTWWWPLSNTHPRLYKYNNATVLSAVTATDSAQSEFIYDQDPAGDIREKDLQKS